MAAADTLQAGGGGRCCRRPPPKKKQNKNSPENTSALVVSGTAGATGTTGSCGSAVFLLPFALVKTGLIDGFTQPVQSTYRTMLLECMPRVEGHALAAFFQLRAVTFAADELFTDTQGGYLDRY